MGAYSLNLEVTKTKTKHGYVVCFFMRNIQTSVSPPIDTIIYTVHIFKCNSILQKDYFLIRFSMNIINFTFNFQKQHIN